MQIKKCRPEATVPLSQSRTYSAAVLVPSAPKNDSSVTSTIIPLALSGSGSDSPAVARTPHSHSSLHTDKKKKVFPKQTQRQGLRQIHVFYKATRSTVFVDTAKR